jgi:hypothetical protein
MGTVRLLLPFGSQKTSPPFCRNRQLLACSVQSSAHGGGHSRLWALHGFRHGTALCLAAPHACGLARVICHEHGTTC